MMTKKDFLALADELRGPLNGPIMVNETGKPCVTIQGEVVNALCRFLERQNPKFDEQKFREALAGQGE